MAPFSDSINIGARIVKQNRFLSGGVQTEWRHPPKASWAKHSHEFHKILAWHAITPRIG